MLTLQHFKPNNPQPQHSSTQPHFHNLNPNPYLHSSLQQPSPMPEEKRYLNSLI